MRGLALTTRPLASPGAAKPAMYLKLACKNTTSIQRPSRFMPPYRSIAGRHLLYNLAMRA